MITGSSPLRGEDYEIPMDTHRVAVGYSQLRVALNLSPCLPK